MKGGHSKIENNLSKNIISDELAIVTRTINLCANIKLK